MKLKFFTLFLFLTFYTFAQSPNEQIKTFFELYKESPENAVRQLMTKNTVAKASEANLEKLLVEFRKIDPKIYGKFMGYELITEKNVSHTLVMNSYIIKHEFQPLRFTFTFYKADDEWKVYHFNFDAKFLEEMMEASKLYYQNLNSL